MKNILNVLIFFQGNSYYGKVTGKFNESRNFMSED